MFHIMIVRAGKATMSVVAALLLFPSWLLSQVVELPYEFLQKPVSSPYGVVFTDQSGSRLYVSSENAVRTLVEARGCGNGNVLDPLGTMIGFKRIELDGRQTPAVVDVVSGDLTLLSAPARRVGQVSFALDGTRAFAMDEDLVLRKNDTSWRVPIGYYANTAPISPDARSVVFNDAGDQLWVMNLQTREKERITDGRVGYCKPHWSPDGSRILYRALNGDGFVYALRDGKTLALGQALSPSWSPDGYSVIFHRAEITGQEFIDADLFCASIVDGTIRQLTDTPTEAEMDAVFARDGRSIFYQERRTSKIASRQAASILGNVVLLDEPSSSVAAFVPERFQMTETAALQKSVQTSQLDIPYVHQTYDTPDWHSGGSSCAPTAAIMVLAYYKLLPPWPTYCSWPTAHYNNWGNYVASKYYFRSISYTTQAGDAATIPAPAWGGFGYMWSGGRPYTRMAGYFQNHGMTAVQSDGTPHSTVISEIQAGRPFTLCVMLTTAGHLVIPHGIGAEEHTFIFNDPYGDKNQGYKNYYGKNVQYDWPGYNNGFQNLTGIAWGIATAYSDPAINDTIVEDLQFSNGFYLHTQAPATMEKWRSRIVGLNGHSWLLQTTTADTCYASWSKSFAAPGRYEVRAYIPTSSNAKAFYKVTHAGGTSTIEIDQAASLNAWVSLGVFDFGSSGSVRLGSGSNAVGSYLGFDAMSWNPVSATDVGKDRRLPVATVLEQNYPNPFNPSTTLSFGLSVLSQVDLRVFDLLGREMAVIVSGVRQPGYYQERFDASGLPGGVFICRLRTQDPQGNILDLARKLILLK